MRGAEPLVVDASVALKWVLHDERSVEQAIRLRDDSVEARSRVLAPSLWIYEVANGLATAARRGRLDDRMALRMLDRLLAAGVELVDPTPGSTLRVALRHGVSAYDAAYVALAEATEALLWSGDRRLCTAVGARMARWIGDYPGP